MASEFSTIEIRLIRSLISHKSDADIAMILEREEGEVSQKIHEITGGVGPFQIRMERRKIAEEKRLQKIEAKNRKAEQRKQKQEASITKKQEAFRNKLLEDFQREERQEQRSPRRRDKKVDPGNEKKKEVKALIAKQNADRRQKNRENEKPKFVQRTVDYSQLVSVRVDSKTIIYIKPGEDPEIAKKKYIANLKKPQFLPTTVQVKKFKPIK
jgi:hypothetical protein